MSSRPPKKSVKSAAKKKAPSSNRSGGGPNKGGPKDSCFVIMPFGGWFDTYFEKVYKPAIEACGLQPRRADDLYTPSAIINDIWKLTQSAKIIVADLTGKNPNVLYELGLAHAIARPAVLISNSIEDVPFDLRSLRVIVYDASDPNWGAVLRESLEEAIRQVLASPLDAVLPTFLKVKDDESKPVSTETKELISIRQDVDLLKREVMSAREVPLKMAPGKAVRSSSVELFPTSALPPIHVSHNLIGEDALLNALAGAIRQGHSVQDVYIAFKRGGYKSAAVLKDIERAVELLPPWERPQATANISDLKSLVLAGLI